VWIIQDDDTHKSRRVQKSGMSYYSTERRAGAHNPAMSEIEKELETRAPEDLEEHARACLPEGLQSDEANTENEVRNSRDPQSILPNAFNQLWLEGKRYSVNGAGF
jgi:hypothetical protein